MGKNNAAPTHGWVIASHFNTFVVRLCLLLIACLVIAMITLTARLSSNCHDVAHYDFTVFGYETHMQFNKEASTCTS
jgi:uncharacterized membrane protein YccF (DUF307 family)